MPAKNPAIVRLIDFLGEDAPKWLAKHPVLTATGIGVGLGAANTRGPEHMMEGSLMAEQLGVPGSKYAHDTELQQFAAYKNIVSTKLLFEKKADWDWTGGFSQGLGRETARTGIGAVRQAISAIADAVKNKAYTQPLQQSILQEVVDNDPVVSTFESEQPGRAAQAYETMKRFAPELSTDKHIVTAFLRNAAMSGGPMDYNMIKGIADAEAAIHKARNEANWYPGGKV